MPSFLVTRLFTLRLFSVGRGPRFEPDTSVSSLFTGDEYWVVCHMAFVDEVFGRREGSWVCFPSLDLGKPPELPEVRDE